MPEIKDSNQDYYTEKGRKISDFFIGFFGIIIAGIVITSFFSLFLSFGTGYYNTDLLGFSTPILLLILGVVATVLSFAKGRRYIGIGIISSVLVPLLIFGACLLVIFGSGGL